MTDNEVIGLVRRYFAAVDAGNLAGVLDTLAIDCKFSVETHGIELNGHHELTGNVSAPLAQPRRHGPRPEELHPRRLPGPHRAALFQVVNTGHDGSATLKSNCDFFTIERGRSLRMQVYMIGETTLDLVERA